MPVDALERLLQRFRKRHQIDPRYTILEANGRCVKVSDRTFLPDLRAAFIREGLSGIRVSVLPDGRTARKPMGIIAAAVAPLHRHPGHRWDVHTEVFLGNTVRVLERQADWLRVAGPDGYIGYVDAQQVWQCTRKEFADWAARPMYAIRALDAPVYETRRASSPVLHRATVGAVLPVMRRHRGWVQVAVPLHGTGWLRDVDMFDYPRFSLRQRLVRTAQQFLGVPYFWGGTSVRGMDCSGLTQIVYGLHGIQIPRDADEQITVGKSLGRRWQESRPGDLLFFGEDRITHVGMYIGGGAVIHARSYVRKAALRREHRLYDRRLVRQFQEARVILP